MEQIDLGDDAVVLEPHGPGEWVEAVTDKVLEAHQISSEAALLYREWAKMLEAMHSPPKPSG
ncbi:hypothetical protein [Ensifer sp.]|uniref:hypothetical protein n=1 Tax=Ensifer sp. TaxID=1872086 RepID=UPI000DD7C3B9|nr:hypothetical protein [Ensifer sp.]